MLRSKTEVAMAEKTVRDYFEHQVHLVIERSASEPEGFVSYFIDHEPKDDEILGLLAVSTMMSGEFHRSEFFPSPVEALAALSPADRAEICNLFRTQLRKLFRTTYSA
jgi:hypothetical protein